MIELKKNNSLCSSNKLIFIFSIITFCLPKAGITTSGLPITVAMCIFGITLISNIKFIINEKISFLHELIYIYILTQSLVTILLNIKYLSPMNIAYILVIMASPFAYFFGTKFSLEKSKQILSVSLIIVGAFSLIQFFFGVIETSIPGITIALGDDYTRKNIIRKGIGISKIPSTYQNGTLLAPFLIIAISFLLQYKKRNRITYAAVVMGVIALMLSGSRSSIFAAIVLIPILLIRLARGIEYKNINKTFMFVYLIPIFVLILIIILKNLLPDFLNQVYNSYVGFTKNDTTFSGRTVQWNNFIQLVKGLNIKDLFRLLFYGIRWDLGDHMEGLPLLMKLYGFMTFCLYLAFIATVFFKYRKLKYISYALMVLTIIFMIDGSIFYPPTLMNIFLILGMSKPMLKPNSIYRYKEEE